MTQSAPENPITQTTTNNPMTQPEADNPVAHALVEAGVLCLVPDDPITFASGLKSPVYMDVRQLIAQPQCWRQVTKYLCETAELLQPDVVAGVAVGGIPHSTAVAVNLALPSCFIRLTQKSHGRSQPIDGAEVSGQRVVLVEDVVTTGGSSLAAVELLRAQQAEVVGCLAIAGYGFEAATEAFRQAGVSLLLLAPFSDVLAAAEQNGRFPVQALAAAQQWHADPHSYQTS